MQANKRKVHDDKTATKVIDKMLRWLLNSQCIEY